MRFLSVLMITILALTCYAQQTQSAEKPAEVVKPEYDPLLPSLIFYIDGKSKESTDFITTVTLGMRGKVNFAAFDVNASEGAKGLKQAVNGLQVPNNCDMVCIIGKDSDTLLMLGSKDISQWLQKGFQHYSRPDLFEKPKLEYAKIVTIADEFGNLRKYIENAMPEGSDKELKVIQEMLKVIGEADEDDVSIWHVLAIIGFLLLSYFIKEFRKKKQT